MNSPPVKRERGGRFTTTPNFCYTLIHPTPLVGAAQPRCAHGNTRIEQLTNGPHYAKEVCTNCGRVLRWLPKPETIERRQRNGFRLAKLDVRDGLVVGGSNSFDVVVKHPRRNRQKLTVSKITRGLNDCDAAGVGP
jgi:hypothetical protein